MNPQDDLTPQELEDLKKHLEAELPKHLAQHAPTQGAPGGAGAAIDPAVITTIIGILGPIIQGWWKNRKAKKGGGGTPATP